MASNQHDDDGVHFFSKNNPVNIQLYYDPARGFVAIASVNGEQLCEKVSEEEPGDALDEVAGVLLMITDDPTMFNDRIRKIGEEARTGPKPDKPKGTKDTTKKIVQLRPSKS